ncbi:MAG TPA: hypothetical protein ENH85_02615 [Candidatus Scalindua sp.]|nr:hypothetical protein [Candidatus Scalindua sp.]
MGRRKQNARMIASNIIILEIRKSKKIPDICKELMIENVHNHMHSLGSALGCIELAARRADMHGIKENKK